MVTLLALGALIGFLLHVGVHYRACLQGYTRLRPAQSANRFSVSVIIPARNEARDIGSTVESLRVQRGVDLEVLVVDDHSSDATASIVAGLAAEDPRVRLLTAPLLPTGWLGKPHALAYGASEAQYPWLLFVDADIRFAPDAVASAVLEAEARHVDLLTLVPRTICGGFWERVIQPVMAAVLFYGVCFAKVNDPVDSQSVGIGAFLLIRREAYTAVGGHAAIRDRIVDDYALAQRVKRAGRPIWLADGGDLIAIRMYHGLAEIWRGWSKNLYDGLRLPIWVRVAGYEWYLFEDRPVLVLGFFIAFLTGLFLLPPVTLLWALVAHQEGPTLAMAWGVTALFLLFGGMVCRGVGLSPGWVATFPLGAAMIIAMAVNSVWQALVRGGPIWRGRRYLRS